MGWSVSLFVALVSAACSAAAPSEVKSVALGESFGLKVGESAEIGTEALEIGLEDVSGDSRCPKGERCVWEGDATVQVWLQKAHGPKETLKLHTLAKEGSAMSDLGYGVNLLRLDPYPLSGRTIERGDYQATLEVTRGSSAAPQSR